MPKFVQDRAKKLEERAHEIGRVCVAWSALELDVTVFLASVVQFPNAPSKNIILGSMDFNSKIAALGKLAFTVKPNDQWYDELTVVLKRIQDKIRLERNRLIHDFWVDFPNQAGDTEVHRVQFKATVKNDKLNLVNAKPVTSEDIRTVCEDIYQASADVLILQLRLANA